MKKQEPGTEDGMVTVFVTKWGVQLRIDSVEDGAPRSVARMTLSPETARRLAQKLTLASFRHEEMYGEGES